MPTTRENVAFIRQRVPNYSIEQVLARLNEVHRIIYSSDSDQIFKIDSSTGLPPYLATTAGQYEYTCPADCRRTVAIFSQRVPPSFQRTRPVGPQKEYYFKTRGYYDVPVSSRDRLVGVDPTVTFQFDPGTTTNVYLHLYSIEPNEIETLDDEMQVPEHVHYMLRDVVLQMFSDEQYGTMQQKHADIQRMFRRIRSELNRGAQGRMNRTPWPEEHQVWDEYGYYGYLQ